MPTDVVQAARLLEFGDSMLPIGGFSFSNALEPAVQEGVVCDVETLRSFVRTVTQRAATSDGIALLEAHRAATGAFDVDRMIRADHEVVNRKLNEEMRSQTVRMGKKLVEVGVTLLASPLPKHWLELIRLAETPGTYPVGLGIISAEVCLSEQGSFAIHQYGMAMSTLSAALRLMKVDHLDTQTILFDLSADFDCQYEQISTASLMDMTTFSPMTDILSARHVHSHVRLFMN